MSNHHRASTSSENQQTVDESAVLEGEVLSADPEASIEAKIAKGRSYSQSKAKDAAGIDTASNTGQTVAKPSWFSRYRGYVLWTLMFAVVILALFVTRPNTGWQVQHINALQADVSQLYQDNQLLESRLSEQEAKGLSSQKVIEAAISQALGQAENKPLVSHADLDEIKLSTQQQLAQLKTNLLSLTEPSSVPLGDLQESAKQLLNSVIDKAFTQEPIEPSTVSEVTLQKTSPSLAMSPESIKLLEEKLQNQIAEMDTKLSKLSDFNAQQQALTTEQALSAFQIQQWIVEINTQWIMQGRAEQTAQQLLALEQAVGLSSFPEVTTLARLIGQDLAHLQSVQNTMASTTLINTSALKSAVKNLSVIDNKVLQAHNASTLATQSTQANAAKIYAGEEISSESAWDQLLVRLGKIISLKKRETSTEQSQVESLIMQDVFVQRGLLLIDRVDWALQTQSSGRLQLAVADLQAFVDVNLSTQSLEFSKLLAPFKSLKFELRQPLAISSVAKP